MTTQGTDAALGWQRRRAEIVSQQASWYHNLDVITKRSVRQLHQINPAWNLTAIFFVALWMLGGVVVMKSPHWIIQCVGYVFIGTIIHGIGNFMHEGIHGNLFRSRRLDYWAGFLAEIPVLFRSQRIVLITSCTTSIRARRTIQMK